MKKFYRYYLEETVSKRRVACDLKRGPIFAPNENLAYYWDSMPEAVEQMPIYQKALGGFILAFRERADGKPLKVGEEIRILPEWQDKGDETFRWFVVRDEHLGTVGIRAETGLPLSPWSYVDSCMVERVKP